MNGFAAEPSELKAQELQACQRVIESGWYVLGNEVAGFEAEWAQAVGVAHCVGVGNGMDAAEIIMRGLGIGPGDEVITTPMTAFATVLAIVRSGATPVLADIDPTTGLLDPASVRRCLSARTKALVLVHLYGQVRAMGTWLDLCAEANIHLIEDCAQAHGAHSGGRAAGSFGTAAAFSFYPTKNLGALGDAGAITTDDSALASLSSSLRNYGQSVRYHHPNLGLNSRLDEMQAAILRARLPWLAAFTARRRQVAQAYRERIDHPGVRQLATPEEPQAHVYHQFVVLVEARDAFMQYLAGQGIESLIHYPIPVHHQECLVDIAHDPQGLGSAEAFARMCVSIPCHPQLTDADVDQVIEAINGWPGP